MASKHISLPSTFAEGDPTEWFQRFDICCRTNDWNDETKAKKLPTLLEGEALAIWLELTEAEKANYQDSKGKLIARMAPVSSCLWEISTPDGCAQGSRYRCSFTS